GVPKANGSSQADSAGAKKENSSKADAEERPSSERITLEQLAAPEDAMSIPDIVTKLSPSVVGISCITGQGQVSGTGIVLDGNGYVVTNAHVVEGATAVSVVLTDSTEKKEETDDSSKSVAEQILEDQNGEQQDNNTIEAEIVGVDTQTDLAVLKVDRTDLKPAEFGTSSNIMVGELAIVIGNPLGFDLANTVTSGIISATDRKLTIEDRTMTLIQTDASINSGNSGGPLINAYGQVIGITSAKVSSTYGEGLGFAIPIDEAMPVIKSLMENGYVKRPSLGVAGRNVSATYAEYYNIPRGYQVVTVTKGSGAEKAGVKPNDIIIGINDTSVSTLGELNVIKNKCKIGDTVKLTIYRDGKMIDLNVTLDEAKSSEEDTTKSSERDYSQQYKSYSDLFRDYLNNF
ncbi:MAG: trypsin-like peptidase domain-containing protein, partial [Ruminococcus sp.]|nr:trypsin-like peptidase domain-containing protein [Ruminococcus sp.]